MKKLAIICEWAGKVHRGGESFALELGNYLVQYYEVDMYTRAEKIDDFSGNVITIDYKENYFLNRYARFYKKNPWFQKIIRCNRYTSVLEPSSFCSFIFGKAVFRKIEKKGDYCIIHPITGPGCHWCAKRYRGKTGTPFWATGGGGIGPWEWWVLKSKPDYYVCISAEQYRWAKRYSNKVTWIPNGTYISNYDVMINKEKYRINKGHKLVICAGHLDSSFKRHQLVIDAVSRLDNVDLLILGYGEEKEKFEKMGEVMMPGRIKIMGVPHNEMTYYYKSADLFTLPSLNEPFGTVYIEAMAAGLPCVGTDDETRREIIGNAGIVCNVDNPEEYAKAIREALEADWGNLPYERACCYDYSIIGEKYVEMIEGIIKKNEQLHYNKFSRGKQL